jgi:carboxylate-amine ligase
MVVRSFPRFQRASAEDASRQPFDDHERPFTVGVEEELMLLDPETLDLLPACGAALERLDDARFRSELPAAQLELVSPVCLHADDLPAALIAARCTAVERLDGFARLAGAGVHPFAAPEGAASAGARYTALSERYQWAARRAMTCGVHVHVAVPGCDRAVAIHDALRAHLPELAALAGNAPFHEGGDTGLHSVRPKLCESLPRQGIPPPLESWAGYRELLAWGAAGNAFPASEVWWEVRLHAVHGTVEVRVCDQPATAEESATLAAVVQALCAWLSMRHDAGGLGPPAPTVRIQENRWRALRHGLDGAFLDLDTGRPEPARERLAALLTTLEPVAAGLGASEAFAGSWTMLKATGSARQRTVAAEAGGDLHAVMEELAASLEDEALARAPASAAG